MEWEAILQMLRAHQDNFACAFHARGELMIKSLPLTPEQRIKEPEQQLAESEVKAQFFEAVVKVMNTEFGATLTKKQLASFF